MTSQAPLNTPEGFRAARHPLVPLRSRVLVDRTKVSPKEMEGRTVYHYSIPAVQELGTAYEDDGASIASEKWLVFRPVVLISKLNPRKGTVTVAMPHEELTVASSEFILVTTGSQTDDRYLAYVLGTTVVSRHLDSLVTSVTRSHQRVSPNDVLALGIPWPSPDERGSLVDFLDRETAQIDAMIEAKEVLATKLRERREAVRDGLVQHASRSSNVERLSRLAEVTVGIVVTPAKWYADKGVAALRGTNIKDEHIDTSDLVHLTDEGHRLHGKSALFTGDVVVVRTGQAGVAAVIPPQSGPINAIDLLIVRPGPTVRGDYLAMCLNSRALREQVRVGSVGAIQSHFNVGSLRKLEVPVPSPTRQEELLNEWRRAKSGMDQMMAAADTTARLLKERREALITAAVTGRIDPETGIEHVTALTEREAS